MLLIREQTEEKVMPVGTESNKAKIARRVVEVLDYFDDQHPHATVMDIVRRYNRPQSSTSELLSSLVELGLLYKDAPSRSYAPTPRAALMGAASQPSIFRNGILTGIIDRLVAQTGLSAAIYGMVGLNAQIFSFKAGTRGVRTTNPRGFSCGLQDQLCNSGPGWLLLSTIMQPRRDGVIRRLNAEAAENKKFSTVEMGLRIENCINTGTTQGPAGFGAIADSCTILLPGQPENQRIAIGFIYDAEDQVDPAMLVECLRDIVNRAVYPPEADNISLPLRSNVAYG
jgi:DNA-binding IclR family transcriptional regulator